MMDLAIIIVNYKMRAQVEECLASLFQDLAGSVLRTQVILIDNASADGLLAWAQITYPSVMTLPSGGNVGFAQAYNLGLRAVGARYYLVLNPDTKFFEAQTIQHWYEWMEAHPTVGVSGPRLLNSDRTLQYSCHRFPGLLTQPLRRTSLASWLPVKKAVDAFLLKKWAHDESRPVDWLMGSALLVRAAALTTVGLLDERFWMYYEDTDWCRRFWQAGWLVYYVPRFSIIHHHGRASARVQGIWRALLTNHVAREHIKSWLRYFWKWRHDTRPWKII